MDWMKFYNKSPVWAQNVACSLVGVGVRSRKYGRREKRELPAFLERARWDYESLCSFRDESLQSMIRFCAAHVPYYRDLFRMRSIRPEEIRTLADLQQLPILTKQMVTERFRDFIADNANLHDAMLMHTSGTTGSSFSFYYSKDAYARQWAAEERYERSVGVTGREWRAYFGGRAIVPLASRRGPYYRVNYAMKEVMFSAFHLSEQHFPSYLEGLQRFQPTYWHGYPSAIGALAQYMLDHGIRLRYRPNVILLASEQVTEETVRRIEAAFQVRPLQNYAQTEQVAHIRQRPDGRMFVVEDLTAVELIALPGTNQSRVIGSTLTNYVMPLLRYDTSDLVTWRMTPEGREILSIDGRLEDDILFRDGGRIRRLSRLFHDQPQVKEAQIVQKSLDLVVFRVVRAAAYSSSDEQRLRAGVQAYLQDHIGFQIEYVDSIERTKNGKVKFVVSEL